MEKCNICGKSEEQASAGNPDKGMMWDGIMECWICQECDKKKIKKVLYSGQVN